MISYFEITAADSIPHKYPMDSISLLDDRSPTKPPPTLSFTSGSENDDVEAGCRICLETDTHGDELISPCMCKGTQQFVHRSCLDNWRSVKVGFAFTHCTTCRAQYHLQVAGEEIKSWSNIKFRLFVARDVLLIFLSVQVVIATLGGFAYAMDNNGSFRNSFNDSWDRTLSKHPFPFYYTVGCLTFLTVGVIGLLVHCYSAQLTSSDQHGACFYVCVSDVSFSESLESCLCLAVVNIAWFAMFVIAYGVFASSMLFQRIWQRHHHIIDKKELTLTKEYVVVDLKGQYTVPTLDREHEEHLRTLKLL